MKFDLSANPFLALGLTASANVREISDAVQDAIDDGLLSEDAAVRLRQVLTTPKQRLDAELSALPDVDRKTAQPLRTVLLANHGPADLASFEERLHSLPRSNLLAHSVSRFGGDAAVLRRLFDAQEACAPGGVTEALNEERERAGFPSVERAAVEAGLRALFARQFQSAVDGFADPERLADEIGQLCMDLVRNASSPIERLDTLLGAFGQAIEAELSRRSERVRAACDMIEVGSRADQAYRELADAVSRWLRLTAPLRIVEASKGRDDPRTRQLYETVNGLGIRLTNEKGDNEGALRILRIARDAFGSLPRAIEQIEANIAIVEGNLLWSHVEPLVTYVGTVVDDVRGLDADLSKNGFGTQSVGTAKELFLLFERAEKASRGTEAHHRPWTEIRGLAVELTNEHKLPNASQKLLAGLRGYAATHPPPEGLAERIDADWMTARDNVAYGLVTDHLKAGRLKEAEAACATAIAATGDGDNRANFTAMREMIRKKRTSKFTKTVGWIAAAVFVIYLFASNQGTNPPRRSASAPSGSASPARPVSVEDRTETIPAERAAGGAYSRANVRYCRYQDARIESARAAADTNAEIDRFNALVQSYNGRCGSFRYRQGDWDAVTAELAERQGQLAMEGRALLR